MRIHGWQRGMAVVGALLIAALVALLAAEILARQARASRALESESQRLAAAWSGRGVLEWCLLLLHEERQRDPVTRLGQDWAQPLRDLRPGGGPAFDGQIRDEQGLFNLRNLVRDDGQVDPLELAAFQRLGELLGLAPQALDGIVRHLREVYPARLDASGAALPARRPMPRVLDDLAGAPGVAPQTLERLRPFVTLLPLPAWLNGNTAPAEVLAARVPGLGLERARALLAERERGQWFINSGDFINRLRLPGLRSEALRVGITSEWFRVVGSTRVGQRQVPLEALLFRPEEARPRIVWSRLGP